jgi:hypothetical protein
MYEYFLIQAESAVEMNYKVNEMLAQGWEPYMGLVIASRESELRCLFQWMSRIAPPPAPLRLPPFAETANVGREKQREA